MKSVVLAELPTCLPELWREREGYQQVGECCGELGDAKAAPFKNRANFHLGNASKNHATSFRQHSCQLLARD